MRFSRIMIWRTNTLVNRAPLICALLLSAVPLAGAESDVATATYNSSAAAMLAGGQLDKLTQAIATYADIRANGGWQSVPVASSTLRAGQRDTTVRTLRRRLRLTGDYMAEMGADPLLFDASLTLALQRFQRRHGLYADGRISNLTVDALNLSVEARIAELEYARAAWTALSSQTSTKSVWVNIPEAEIAALADARIALRMRVVVGHPSRPTPQLSSQINRVIVDPYWNVPQSIALQDLLPRQQADPQFFSRKGIRVYANWQDDARELEPAAIDWAALGNTHFPYRLRQDPGPENSLGRYKFDFPNDFDVYIHDTPSRVLLGLSMRSLSSGCVRVEDSAALARWLMGDMPNVERQLAIDANRRTRGIRLPYPVPVNFVYLNAWVGAADGAVQFRRDIYGLTLATDLTAAR